MTGNSLHQSGRVAFGALVLPNEAWADLEARWRRLEMGGIDSIWSCDHFTNPHRPGEPWFEGWTGLAALSAGTTRVRVGLLVGAIVSRPPMMLAQQAKVVDHITKGRVVIGLGAGGAPTDQAMWGMDNWSPQERASRFSEYVELVAAATTNEEVSFSGQWYRTEGATMAPGFVQSPHPPLLVAAHGERTLAVAARFADTWNTVGPTLDDARRMTKALDDVCWSIGRDPNDVARSVLFGIRRDTAWASAKEFAELVQRWHAAGFREFLFYDPPYGIAGLPVADSSVIDELLESTIPSLRSELDPT